MKLLNEDYITTTTTTTIKKNLQKIKKCYSHEDYDRLRRKKNHTSKNDDVAYVYK